MDIIEQEARRINRENFSRYGRHIQIPEIPQEKNLVNYWDKVDVLPLNSTSVGIVESYPSSLRCEAIERHKNTTETIIPTSGRIYVVVATGTDRNDAEAFMIPAGEAVTLNEGVWHSVPLVTEHDTKSFIIFNEGTPESDFELAMLTEKGFLYQVVEE